MLLLLSNGSLTRNRLTEHIRESLLDGDIAEAFFLAVLKQARDRPGSALERTLPGAVRLKVQWQSQQSSLFFFDGADLSMRFGSSSNSTRPSSLRCSCRTIPNLEILVCTKVAAPVRSSISTRVLLLTPPASSTLLLQPSVCSKLP